MIFTACIVRLSYADATSISLAIQMGAFRGYGLKSVLRTSKQLCTLDSISTPKLYEVAKSFYTVVLQTIFSEAYQPTNTTKNPLKRFKLTLQ